MDILCSCPKYRSIWNMNIGIYDTESEYKDMIAICHFDVLEICLVLDIHSLTLYIFPFSIQSSNALKFLLGGINLIHYLFPQLRTFEGHQLLLSFY